MLGCQNDAELMVFHVAGSCFYRNLFSSPPLTYNMKGKYIVIAAIVCLSAISLCPIIVSEIAEAETDECSHHTGYYEGGYYICDYCGQKFTDSHSYEVHLNNHAKQTIEKSQRDATVYYIIFGAIAIVVIAIIWTHKKNEKEKAEKRLEMLENLVREKENDENKPRNGA